LRAAWARHVRRISVNVAPPVVGLESAGVHDRREEPAQHRERREVAAIDGHRSVKLHSRGRPRHWLGQRWTFRRRSSWWMSEAELQTRRDGIVWERRLVQQVLVEVRPKGLQYAQKVGLIKVCDRRKAGRCVLGCLETSVCHEAMQGNIGPQVETKTLDDDQSRRRHEDFCPMADRAPVWSDVAASAKGPVRGDGYEQGCALAHASTGTRGADIGLAGKWQAHRFAAASASRGPILRAATATVVIWGLRAAGFFSIDTGFTGAWLVGGVLVDFSTSRFANASSTLASHLSTSACSPVASSARPREVRALPVQLSRGSAKVEP